MYEIPSGVPCIITKGVDYSTRRETATTKRLAFKDVERVGAHSYQFFARGWFMVVPKLEVRVTKDPAK